jgi:hypothetical protein
MIDDCPLLQGGNTKSRIANKIASEEVKKWLGFITAWYLPFFSHVKRSEVGQPLASE